MSLVPRLYCSDFTRSLRFYAEILGFKINTSSEPVRLVYLERDGAVIMIEEPIATADKMVAGELTQPYGRGIYFRFAAEDVDSLYTRIQSNNCSIFRPLEDKWFRANNIERG